MAGVADSEQGRVGRLFLDLILADGLAEFPYLSVNIEEIIDALLSASEQKNQPTMIILNTVKGKGVSFMENNIDFHGVPPNEMEYKLAMKELETAQKALEATL